MGGKGCCVCGSRPRALTAADRLVSPGQAALHAEGEGDRGEGGRRRLTRDTRALSWKPTREPRGD